MGRAKSPGRKWSDSLHKDQERTDTCSMPAVCRTSALGMWPDWVSTAVLCIRDGDASSRGKGGRDGDVRQWAGLQVMRRGMASFSPGLSRKSELKFCTFNSTQVRCQPHRLSHHDEH